MIKIETASILNALIGKEVCTYHKSVGTKLIWKREGILIPHEIGKWRVMLNGWEDSYIFNVIDVKFVECSLQKNRILINCTWKEIMKA